MKVDERCGGLVVVVEKESRKRDSGIRAEAMVAEGGAK